MKILVAYATNTGNTLTVARKIAQVLSDLEVSELTVKDLSECTPSDLTGFSLIFVGCSTWGDGEYNDYAQLFFDELRASDIDLSQTQCAVFGLGESFYPTFCTVVELMKEDLSAKNAQIISDALKIDGFPDQQILDTVTDWVKTTYNIANNS